MRPDAPSATGRFLRSIGCVLGLATLLVSLNQYHDAVPLRAAAQSQDPLITTKEQADCLAFGDATTARQARTNALRFIGTAPGRPIPNPRPADAAASPQAAARAYVNVCGSLFGLDQPETDLNLTDSRQVDARRSVVRFRQTHQGVPVIAGELIVHVDERRNILAVAGKTLPQISLDTTPTLAADEAARLAIDAVAKTYGLDPASLRTTTPVLSIYSPTLLGPRSGPESLVWRMDVAPQALAPIRELVLIDARRGSIALHFNQVDTLLNRQTYTAGNTTTLPGTLVCNESNPACAGGDSHAIAAHLSAADTYNFYFNTHGRNSIDNAGMPIVSTVHFDTGFDNAFWNGSQMVYGDAFGFPLADDVVAHELTHGVTQFTSGLFSYYQSGAIDESLSDVWGEFVDQTNGRGNDSAGVKWLLGEDVSGSTPSRNMSNPPALLDPDKMTSPLYYLGDVDNGGVHRNAGINNKAAFLMTDGGTFNGQTVTGLGIIKVAKIYYEAQTHLLTSGSDYADLYNALSQACNNLLGTSGITTADCQQVRNATTAVEMNLQPVANFNTDAALCPVVGQAPTNIFFDSFESGSGNWTTASSDTPRWSTTSSEAVNAHSGQRMMWGDDFPAAVSDSNASMATSVAIPAGAFLHFAHAYGFDDPNFDGGVVEYSTNGGAAWIDAGPLLEVNGYKGAIATGFGNPLAGRQAFIGDSHGYVSSRVNLSALAGQNVRFRWRMGLDGAVYDWGWFLDDVRIYTCAAAQPALGINDVVVSEGNSGTKTASFTVTLNPTNPTQTVTVNYATANGTATTANNDYAAAAGTLTFAPGVATQTINVTINGDTFNELDEIYFVNLSVATNATIADTLAFGTILDDDTPSMLTINDVTLPEGNSGTSTAAFTVTLSPVNATQTVTVNYATSNSSATAGSDYVATNGTLTFLPGVATQTINVVVNGDTALESDETFNVSLTAPVNASLGDAFGFGTIFTDDGPPTLTLFDISVTEPNSGTQNAIFTVSLSPRNLAQTVTVNWATADGTATTANNDYVAATGTLTFAPGVVTQPLTVVVNGDTAPELNETLAVNLSNATNAIIGDTQGVATIVDNDTSLLFVGLGRVTEGDAGTKNMTFTVTLSPPNPAQTVTVNYATSDFQIAGAATVGSDYLAASGTLTFAPGATTQTFNVTVIGDTVIEPDESFSVRLSNASNAMLNSGQSDGTIVNDDGPPTLTIGDAIINGEGDPGNPKVLSFTVTLSPPNPTQTVTVDYATADGTATLADNDYVAKSGTLTFAPGSISGFLSIGMVPDKFVEPDETVFFNLSNATNAIIGDAQAFGIIRDDDAPPLPALAINDVTLAEGNSGTTLATFTVSLSPASTQTVTVNYNTSPSPLGNDYVATAGVLTFTPGTTTQTINVQVVGDTLVEPNETFNLILSNAVNAGFSDSSGVGTIVNDDGGPALTISDPSNSEGNSGPRQLIFTVTLSPANDAQTVTVDYATANGTATVADNDYIPLSGTLVFPPGLTSRQVIVTLSGDTANEPNETMFLNLSNATNAVIGDAQGIGTITTDDVPGVTINDINIAEGNAGTTTVTLTLALNPPNPTQTVTVFYATANNSATIANNDYIPTTGTVTFAPGTQTQTVNVSVVGDTTIEGNEQLFVNLTNVTNGGISDNQGIVTIVNDDGPPVLTLGSASFLSEGNSGTTLMSFTVSLAPVNASQTVTVAYATADGTATAASGDYVATAGTLTFPPGTASQTITVPVNGDTTSEANELLFVNLSNPTNAIIVLGQASGTISDDDTSGLSITSLSLAEGDIGTRIAAFPVALGRINAQTVTVDYATGNGTATAGSDYVAASGTLTFAPGATSQFINVTVNSDTVVEANESFTVHLFNATNAPILTNPPSATATITNDDGASTLTINGPTPTNEGGVGPTPFVFTVSLNLPNLTQTVTVGYATADGTATAGTDYTAATGTLTFAPGVTSQQLTVMVNGDLTPENNETLFVNLSAPTNAVLGVSQALGTINNDDPFPSLAISDATVVEGNSGTTPAVFTVTLTPANPTSTVTLSYSTGDSSATAASGDYVSISNTLTFPPGTTTQTITILVNGDTTVEGTESFFVNLFNFTNANFSDSQGLGTIITDDAAQTLTITDTTVTESTGSATSATFNVNLNAPSVTQTITVNYATADGTAIVGSDYFTNSGTLVFPPGVTTRQISVLINGDSIPEGTETFVVNLSSPVNATISDAQGLGTITDNDTPLLSIGPLTLSVTEGNSGTTTALFSVLLSPVNPTQTVTVNYATADGSATTAGGDYQATSGTLTFPPGVSNRAIAVLVNGDTTVEPDETFTVTLSGATNGSISGVGVATGTIVSDDGTPTLTINDVTLTEGNAGVKQFQFFVTLSPRNTSQFVTVNYATANGTADPGDYSPVSGTLTFNPGVSTATINVTVFGDVASENDEQFAVNLSGATNAIIGDNQGRGTIINDDAAPAPALNFNLADGVELPEGNSGIQNFVFPVTLSNPDPTKTVTVNYTTADYPVTTAPPTPGVDYTAVSGTLTFAPGTVTQNINVGVFGDTQSEPTEPFLVVLFNAVNATIGGEGITFGVIDNDDGAPRLDIIGDFDGESNSGSDTLDFTVLLSPPAATQVVVTYATANGTATAGVDYTAASGTLTFAPGETQKNIFITYSGDTVVEPDETLFVNLSNPVNATIGVAQGISKIVNDDPTGPHVHLFGYSPVTAGRSLIVFADNGSGSTTDWVTLSLTSAAEGTYTPGDWFYLNGSKTAPATAFTGDAFMVFTAPSTPGTYELRFYSNGGSTRIATSEPFTVVTLPATVTLSATTLAPGQTFTATAANGPGNPTDWVAFYPTGTPNGAGYVDWFYLNGTKVAPATGLSGGTVTFTAPATIGTYDVRFFSNNTFTQLAISGTLTVAPPLTLAIGDGGIVAEGNSATHTVNFTITLSASATTQPVTVNYATADGTATAGSDYVAQSGTFTFSTDIGETTKTVSVVVNGDTVFEGNETFFVNLSGATNAVIIDNQGISTISNDDSLPALTINDVTLAEGNSGTTAFTFTVTLNPVEPVQTVTVNYATANLTGATTANNDYVPVAGALTFPPGTTTQTVTVQVVGDTNIEGSESFAVNLSNSRGATVADNQGIGLILNDDGASLLNGGFASATSEGNSGTKLLQVVIGLSPANATQTVTVDYATANGTATAGSDYVATSGTLTFAPGVTSQTINVTVNGDTTPELNETLFINMSNPTNAVLQNAQALATINDDDTVTLAIGNASVTEGNSGTVNATFNVTLNFASTQTVTVSYATVDGSATTANNDYAAVSGTLTFAPGVTSLPINVPVNGDTFVEPDRETFFVTLANPTNASFGNFGQVPLGSGSIGNDDGTPALSINNLTIGEGGGNTTFNFNVTLSPPSASQVTVSFATSDGTATVANNDYQALAGTLTFAAGVTSRTISVIVVGDNTSEPNETFFVTLSNPTNAVLNLAQGLGTINNDDPTPALVINDFGVVEGNSGTIAATFTVTMAPANPTQTVTVNYATADATATTADNDYVAASGTLTFAPGTTSQTITVLVNGDTAVEGPENYVVNLSGAVNATIADNQANGGIVTDDLPPRLAISDVQVQEGTGSIVTATFGVSLTPPNFTQTVSVNYSTADGTATAGSDYFSNSGTLLFAPGVSSRAITVVINGDTTPEPDENFVVNLSNPVNAFINDSQAVATIFDNDGSFLFVNGVTVTEGGGGTTSATFTIGLSAPNPTQSVTVNYATADGTATTANNDYVAASGTVTFPPGTTTRTATVLVNGDASIEPDETFLLNLSNPVNAAIGFNSGSATGTILNDDGATPTLTISDVSADEGFDGTTTFTFAINLTPRNFGQFVTVNYATANGTATAPGDYLSTSGSFTFSPGESNKFVNVTVNEDAAVEQDETFFVNLTNATNAVIGDNQGVGTIVNDNTSNLNINDNVDHVEVTEGNSGTTTLVFPVTLSSANLTQTVMVDYKTFTGVFSGEEATPGTDYVAASGTLTFSPGTVTQNVNVTVNGDVTVESVESVAVILSNPVNAQLDNPIGIGTILNDDGGPKVDALGGIEGEDEDHLVFRVVLNPPPAAGVTVTVDYATANGTATAGSDYISTTGTLAFPPGVTQLTVNVAQLQDTVQEPNENFFLNLTNATNATIGNGHAQRTILDDDGPRPGVGVISQSPTSSGATIIAFVDFGDEVSNPTDWVTLSLTSAPEGTFTPGDWVYLNGSRTPPAQGQHGALLGFTAPATPGTYELRVYANNTLTRIATSSPIVVAAQPTLTINDVSLAEGNSGTNTATFTVTLAPINATQTVAVNYATANGTATAGSDYVAASGTLTFAPGTATQTISVTVNGDTTVEPSETFVVNLSNVVNAVIGDLQGIGTITTDDAPPPPSVVLSTSTANPGQAFSATVANGPGDIGNWVALYPTATADGAGYLDWFYLNGLKTPPATSLTGATIAFTAPTTLGTYNVRLFAGGFTRLAISGTLTVAPSPTLAIADVSVAEGNSGTTTATFTVTLAPTNAAQTVTVDYATANGTATAGTDYVAATGTLTFAPGTATQTISVTVNGDTTIEPTESFVVNLTNVTNALIGDAQGIGTITTDDAPPPPSVVLSTSTANPGQAFTAMVANGPGDIGNWVALYPTTTADGAGYLDWFYLNGLKTPPATGLTGATIAFTAPTTLGTYNVRLFAGGFTRLAISGTLTVAPSPTLAIADVSVAEGNSGTTTATFAVTLAPANAAQTVTVDYATANGTATAGIDYVAAAGTLTFAPGATTQTISVTVNGDTTIEPNESFVVNLSNVTNALIGDGVGAGTITTDDTPPGPSVVLSTSSANLGQAFSATVANGPGDIGNWVALYPTATADGAGYLDWFYLNGLKTPPATGLTGATIAFTAPTTPGTYNVRLFAGGFTRLAISGTLTVAPSPTLAIADVSVAEGDSGTTTATFTVTLAPTNAAQTVTVDYATANGTATAGSDYVAASGTLTFAPGATTQTISVTVNGDTTFEPTETFVVNLANVTNALIGDAQGMGTITNDDQPPGPTVVLNTSTVNPGQAFTATVANGPGNVGNWVALYPTATPDGAGYLDWFYLNGLKTPPATGLTGGAIAFMAPTTPGTYNVRLFASGYTRLAVSGTLTVAATPTLAITDVSVAEGDSGTTTATFTVTLAPTNATQTVTVDYATANGTATAGSDYVAASGTLTFAPGTATQTISVTVNGDTALEPTESFVVNLANGTNALLGDTQGIGTITNDDQPPGPTVVLNTSTVNPGQAFTATVANGPGNVGNWVALYPTATPDGAGYLDWFYLNGLKTPPATGLTGGTIAFTAPTTPGTYNVRLFASGYTRLAISGTLTVAATPALTITDVSVAEGDSGTTTATFTVTLAPPNATQTVTVDYATANGTATAGSDYVTAGGTLTFAPGMATQTISVTVNGDTTFEPTETFVVNLANVTNALIGDAQGMGTITNDDQPPGPTVVLNTSTVNPGQAFTATVANGPGIVGNWIALYPTATADGAGYLDWFYLNGLKTPPATGLTGATIAFTAPTTPGTYNVRLFASGYTRLAVSGTLSVAATPMLTITDVSVAEGNSGTTTASFTVTLAPPNATQTVTLDYATANGTATAGTDYVAGAGTLTFASGVTTQTISVTVNGDTTIEPNETFVVNLTNVANALIGDAQGVGTITNDETPPAPSVVLSTSTLNPGQAFNATVANGPGNVGNWVALYPTATADGAGYLDWFYLNGLKTPPATGLAGATIAFTAPATPGMYDVRFFSGGYTRLAVSGTLTVAATPTLTITDVSVAEGNSGTTMAAFTVTLAPPNATQTVTVDWATAAGTANPLDYQIAGGTLTFPPGTATQTINVTVFGDTTFEPNETFVVNLSNAVNAAIGDAVGSGTITNDDPAPSPSVTLASATVSPGQAFSFTVANGPGNATDWVTISPVAAGDSAYLDWSYLNGLKTPPVTGVTGATLQFTAPMTPGMYNVRLFVNNVLVKIATSGTLTVATATGPTLTITDVSLVEGNSGTSTASFTVTLAPTNATQTVTVDYATANGTATAGSDYVAASGTLTFPPGTATLGINVTVNGDTTIEPNETYTVNLTNVSNALIGDGVGAGTILNDETPPGPSVTLASATANPGESVGITVANGPGSSTDWVAIYPAAAGDVAGFLDWLYLNGSKMPPASGLTSATLQFTAPTTPGSYNVRLFTNNTYTKLATSGTLTVNSTAPLALLKQPDAELSRDQQVPLDH